MAAQARPYDRLLSAARSRQHEARPPRGSTCLAEAVHLECTAQAAKAGRHRWRMGSAARIAVAVGGGGGRSWCAGLVSMACAMAMACPPPPPPAPTLEQQAERQWFNAENLCIVTLVEASLKPTRVERGGRWSMAQAHWQVQAVVSATLKGRCGDGPVVLPELSPAMCGLGMAPLGTPLLAAVDDDASLSWWAPTDVPLAVAVRALAIAGPAPGR